MDFDQYRCSYDADINQAIAFSGQEHAFYLHVKAAILIELLRRHLPATRLDVLDVGCGNGGLHQFLRPAGISLTGIEVAPQFIEVARQANQDVAYDLYDGHQLPYSTGRFNAAFTVCVMHHVPPEQWLEFVVEMRRVVRPGGLVVIFEHNPYNPITAHIVRTCPIDRDAVLLKPAVLKSIMREGGLEKTTRQFILFTPFRNSLFRRLDRLLRWLPLGAQYVSFGRVPKEAVLRVQPR
jgi:SAM-dependent methyltransferase